LGNTDDGEVISTPSARSAREIEDRLADYLARILQIDRGAIDRRRPFAEYGLDSLAAVTLSGELERWLGRELSPTLAWDYPTIDALARHLATRARP
jgi:acyl carrier protein